MLWHTFHSISEESFLHHQHPTLGTVLHLPQPVAAFGPASLWRTSTSCVNTAKKEYRQFILQFFEEAKRRRRRVRRERCWVKHRETTKRRKKTSFINLNISLLFYGNCVLKKPLLCAKKWTTKISHYWLEWIGPDYSKKLFNSSFVANSEENKMKIIWKTADDSPNLSQHRIKSDRNLSSENYCSLAFLGRDIKAQWQIMGKRVLATKKRDDGGKSDGSKAQD